MKKDIHPEYNKLTVRLSDGSTFETRSTLDREELVPDVDSTNHPFYTGRRQFVDTAGRVEKFNRRYGLNQDDEGDEGNEDEEE
jgi:large subunit ribosomal protein L31